MKERELTDSETLLTSLVEKLSEKASSSGLSAAQLEQILTKVGVNSAEAMRSSLKPENQEHPHISAFFTKADEAKYGDWTQKPILRRKTYFNGYEENQHEHQLTCDEVEAYNAIQEDREARGGKWKARLKNKGHKTEELYVTIPCETVDQRMEMPPSLLLFLKELNGGQSTEDVEVLIRKIQDLEAQVAVSKGFGTAAKLQADFA